MAPTVRVRGVIKQTDRFYRHEGRTFGSPLHVTVTRGRLTWYWYMGWVRS